MKNLLICFLIVMSEAVCSAQTNLSLEIVGVIKEGGKIHVSLFNSEQSFGSFKKHKVEVTEATKKISVNLYKI